MNPPPEIEQVLEWLYRDQLRHSRLIWRLEADARLDRPWPYGGLWFDPAGAALVDLEPHPAYRGDVPWLHAAFDDPDALGLLCGIRLPLHCAVLADTSAEPMLAALGTTDVERILDVAACRPGELGETAISYEPVRLTHRDRALCAEADWRPDDLHEETDEERGGVRWAILRDGRIASRLLAQRVSRDIIELADVATSPPYRRRGYAAALVQSVVRRVHERGMTATWSAHPSNTPSQRLAAAAGFRHALSWARYHLTRDAAVDAAG